MTVVQIKKGVLLSSFAGFIIIESTPLDAAKRLYQCRFPKSKRKRIRKKWAKNIQNFKKRHTVLKSENRLFVDSEFCNMLLTGDIGGIKREVVFMELASFVEMPPITKEESKYLNGGDYVVRGGHGYSSSRGILAEMGLKIYQ